MKKIGIMLQIRALFSNKALSELYAARRDSQPATGMRTNANVTLSLSLLFMVISTFVIISWVPRDISEFVTAHEQMRPLVGDLISYDAIAPMEASCETPDQCREQLIKKGDLRRTTPAEIDLFANDIDAHRHALVRMKFYASMLAPFSNMRGVVLSLPRYRYYQATAYVNGEQVKSFLMGERLSVVLELEKLRDKDIEFDLVVKLDRFQRTFSGVRNGEMPLLAPGGDYEKFVTYVNSLRSAGSGATGMVAKIAIAMFCLLLFLIIDSSPESLGLALFMGFEAAALGVGEGWIVLGPLSEHKSALNHFFYQMGDIMKLYFMLQIARISQKSASTWLVVGIALSVPYGLFREYAGVAGWGWTYLLSLWRDTIVGTIGGLACLRVAVSLRGQKLPWRMVALVLAGVAGFGEVVASWTAHSKAIAVDPFFQTMFTIIQGNVGYIFALSTFINISTLENRVRSLSKAQARAQEIERELDIARNVQRSLLLPPRLPDGVSLSCYQEAALYVSGDTYFVNHDEAGKKFTWLLNDVTGHGIQAALKASACNVLAKTLWGQKSEASNNVPGFNLKRFDTMTQEVLVEKDRTPDFNSLISAEFNMDSGELSIYRSNFSFPILIRPSTNVKNANEPVLGEFWTVNLITTPNQQIFTMPIPRGTFLMFLSDGFLESSRDLKKFTAYLRRKLAPYAGEIHVNSLNEFALSYEGFAVNTKNDDRTLLIFQWEFESAKSLATSPLASVSKPNTGTFPVVS